MAKFIHANGNEATIHPADKKRGFSLREMYALLDCSMVQAIDLADGRTMWLDEEGKLRDGLLFVNEKATRLLIEAGGIPGDEVVGSVLITDPEEVA